MTKIKCKDETCKYCKNEKCIKSEITIIPIGEFSVATCIDYEMKEE